MLNTRIVSAGAASLLFVAMAAGDAAAQTATTSAPGSPLPLLQILSAPDAVNTKHPEAVNTKHHVKTAAVRHHKMHVAASDRKRSHPPLQAAATPRPAPGTPATNLAPLPNFAAAEPAVQPAPAPSAVVPAELVVAGQTVQIASPDDANELDLAANDAATLSDAAEPSDPPASAAATGDGTEPTAKTDTMTAASAPAPAPTVGSASWIAQVLAAFGGAVAAGSVAWFLIGSAPQRTYS